MDSVAIGLLVISALFVLLLLVLLLDFLTRPKAITLKGKHVVIVGGSTGIGFAMAKQAVLEGANVSITARSAGKLKDAAHLLEQCAIEYTKSQGSKASTRTPVVFSSAADASKVEDMKRFVGEAIRTCGPINVLVCCQGICRPHTFDDWPLESMREHMEANFWGTVNVLKAGALESLRTSGPPGSSRLLIVSSQAGQLGCYGYTAYGATKFALRGLAESLYQELLPYRVGVSMLFPPDTDTPQLQEESLTKPAATKAISATSGPPMAPSDVAAAALAGMKRGDFLVSANLTGFMLNIATAGMAPSPSLIGFLTDVVLAPLMRIVALLNILEFKSIVLKHHKAPETSL